MRRDKVLRFVTMAFVFGAFIGLICGLAFGGSSNPSTARASSDDASATTTSEVAADETTVPNQPMTVDRARAIGANELGQVLVIMYHLIDTEETEWTRTPENFRSDIATLKAEGYYPINVRDLASGNIDIPAGKSPVVITFDDSSPGQYRILDDGTIDPDSAVGILQAAVDEGGWAARATFFPLIDVVPKEREIFGQEDKKQEKLVNLVHWGYEIGSHTVTHLTLKEAAKDEATKQLALSQATLEDLIGGGYEVTTLSVPFGEYPSSDSLLKSGTYTPTQGSKTIKYAYSAAVSIKGEPCASPFSTSFDAYHIPRVRGSDWAEPKLSTLLQQLKSHPELRYVSDGDPTTVSAPKTVDSKLGEILKDLGRPVIRY